MAVAPFVSLCVMPFAFSRVRATRGSARGAEIGRRRPRGPAHAARSRRPPPTCRSSTAPGFAVAVVGIMLAEQTLMNAGVLIVAAQHGVTRRRG